MLVYGVHWNGTEQVFSIRYYIVKVLYSSKEKWDVFQKKDW